MTQIEGIVRHIINIRFTSEGIRQWRNGMRTRTTPNAPMPARVTVAIPIKREWIQPATPKLASKRPIPTMKQNDNGVCWARIEAGITASDGRLAATAAANVIPNVTSNKAIEPATARKAAKAAGRPLVETGRRTPKNVNAKPLRTELTNPNCR